MNRFFLILICMVLLASCASVPLATTEMESAVKNIDTDQESAIIYLFRPYVSGAGSCSWYVSINGTTWGTLVNSSYLVAKVEPGKHLLEGNIIGNVLCPFQEAKSYEVFLKPGSKTYFFAHAEWAAFSFKKIDEHTAQKPLNSFKLSGSNKLFYTLKTGNQLKSIKVQPAPIAAGHGDSSQNSMMIEKRQNELSNSLILSESDIMYLSTSLSNPDGIAVIIGSQQYDNKDIPEVAYAKNDAEAMRKLLINTMGYKEDNIIFQINPTKADFEMIFGIENNHKGVLYDYIKPNKSDVFIYYSGHGAPDINTNLAYFIPKNGNPNKIAFTGYPLDLFYKNITRLPTNQMTVVIDACFSGATDSGKWIVSDASPALLKISNPIIGKDNIAVLTSSKNNQISSWYPEKRHGLFTYFFLKAVYGEADKNQNRNITFKEIYDYVTDRADGVPYWAKRLHGGRVQIPTLQLMNAEQVFLSY